MSVGFCGNYLNPHVVLTLPTFCGLGEEVHGTNAWFVYVLPGVEEAMEHNGLAYEQ